MATNLSEVSFNENISVAVDFINAVAGETGVEADILDIRDVGAVIQWHESTTTHVYLVPWSNIKSMRQSWTD